MIKKILEWAYSHKSKNEVNKKDQRFYKQRIRMFFEGDQMNNAPVIPMSIKSLGITGFKFKKFKKHISIDVYLENPGVLIGKNGKIISKLSKYLSIDGFVKINAVKSKIWE